MTQDASAFDYSEDIKRPANEVFAQLNDQVVEFVAAEKAVKDAESALAQAKQRLKTIREQVLPETLNEIGLSSITTADGLDVTLEEEVHVHVSEERNADAIAWLDAHGQSDLVKRKFVIEFNKDQTALANKFKADLARRKVALNANITNSVHQQTLKKFVKDSLANGEEIPMDTFGVHRRTVAKVEMPKGK